LERLAIIGSNQVNRPERVIACERYDHRTGASCRSTIVLRRCVLVLA
jgi:hypothetical protein